MKSKLILIFLGLVFFFNPSFNMLDVLPDFFGACLIMWGLDSFIYFDANLESAHKNAKYLMWISVLKLVFCMWCNTGHRDYIMPFTFVIAVLETIFMLAMFRSLYVGAEYTLMRSQSQRTPKAINEAFTMSFIFTIAGRLLEFAPQIADISAQDAELDLTHGASFKMPLAQMKMYLLGACLVCGLILGVIYLALTAKAWIKLITDKKYNAFLKEKYTSFLVNDRDVYVTRRLSFAYFLLTLATVFIAEFYVDAVNLIPTFVTVLCVFASVRVVNGLDNRKTNIMLFVGCLAVVLINQMYMSKIHLGINYLYSVETFNREAFPLLESKMSVTYGVVFSFCEAVLMWGISNYALSCMKRVFLKEKRRNVLSRIMVCRVVSALTVLFAASSRVFTCVCGHLATNDEVRNYIQNKAFITSGKIYEQMMQNPDIIRYENCVSCQSLLGVLAFVGILVMLVILVNMKRATEGNSSEMR
ncbi:MAG: hypothetical protein J6K12_06925 [Clostridia bacterium]|nr:hypothetical protein [Clostridia bacterium]